MKRFSILFILIILVYSCGDEGDDPAGPSPDVLEFFFNTGFDEYEYSGPLGDAYLLKKDTALYTWAEHFWADADAEISTIELDFKRLVGNFPKYTYYGIAEYDDYYAFGTRNHQIGYSEFPSDHFIKLFDIPKNLPADTSFSTTSEFGSGKYYYRVVDSTIIKFEKFLHPQIDSVWHVTHYSNRYGYGGMLTGQEFYIADSIGFAGIWDYKIIL
ncbi:MAG: hypothetical protein ACLFR2_07890 [Candidatus Kapaibacterium sp.]